MASMVRVVIIIVTLCAVSAQDWHYGRKSLLPKYHPVSYYLHDNVTHRFYFEHTQSYFTLIITPCTSPLNVELLNWPEKVLSDVTSQFHSHEEGNDQFIVKFKCKTKKEKKYISDKVDKGLFTLSVRSLNPSYVHLLLLPFRLDQTLKLSPAKVKQNSNVIRWNSPDPSRYTYCLILSTKDRYNTLCQALGERYQVTPTSRKRDLMSHQQISPELIMGCVGNNLKYKVGPSLSQFKQLSLFALDKYTNVTHIQHRGRLRERNALLMLGKSQKVTVDHSPVKIRILAPQRKSYLIITSCRAYLRAVLTDSQSVQTIADTAVYDEGTITLKSLRKQTYDLKLFPVDVGVKVTVKLTRNLLSSPPDKSVTFVNKTCSSLNIAFNAYPIFNRYCLSLRLRRGDKKCIRPKHLTNGLDVIQVHCFLPTRTELVKRSLINLQANTDYFIEVFAEDGAGFMKAYNPLNVSTEAKC